MNQSLFPLTSDITRIDYHIRISWIQCKALLNIFHFKSAHPGRNSIRVGSLNSNKHGSLYITRCDVWACEHIRFYWHGFRTRYKWINNFDLHNKFIRIWWNETISISPLFSISELCKHISLCVYDFLRFAMNHTLYCFGKMW